MGFLGGLLGGSVEQETSVPKWLENAARDALGRGRQVADAGFAPWFGPDVAAFTPTQEAAFANNRSAAEAFGLTAPAATGMPAPQTFAGGVQGYSSAPMLMEGISQLNTQLPGVGANYDRLNGWNRMTPPTPAPPTRPGGLGGLGGFNFWALLGINPANIRSGNAFFNANRGSTIWGR